MRLIQKVHQMSHVDIYQDLQEEKKQTYHTLAILAQAFFVVGFIVDSIRYVQEQSWLLFITNLPVIVLIIYNIITRLLKRKASLLVDTISFLFILLNIVYAFWDTVLFDTNIDYVIMRLSVVCIILILSTGFVLGKYWAYGITVSLMLSYISCALYTQNKNLMDNIVLIPGAMLGVCAWCRIYMQLFDKNNKATLSYLEQNKKLTAVINRDRQKLNKAFEDFYDKSRENKENISKELKIIAKLLDYNLPEVVEKHAQKINSNENLFINQILKKHPALTTSELKLSYMLVKGMRTKEIAESSSLAIDSVRVFRTRLRKKLNLVNKENLPNYLKQFDTPDKK